MIINCRLLVPCRDRRMVLADDCILRFEVSSSKHFILFRTLGMVERWKLLRTLSRTKLTTLSSYLKLFRISLQRFVFVSETLTKLTKWRGSNDFPFDMFLQRRDYHRYCFFSSFCFSILCTRRLDSSPRFGGRFR